MEIDSETKGIITKVEKLLRLAAKNPNPEEAARATEKAQELLAAYNLDMAAIEENGETDAKRAQEMLDGGEHEWERELWKYVSALNFCLHWTQQNSYESPLGKHEIYIKEENGRYRWTKGIKKWEHKIVGRRVNVIATKHMASYLQDVAKRLTKEACKKNGVTVRSVWARSFTQGIIDDICYRLYERRQNRLDADLQAAAEARRKAVEDAKVMGHSAATALTLSDYTTREHDENVDFAYGAGTSARWAANRVARAAAAKAADEEYTRWAAANPKEAAKEEARRKREQERREKKADRASFKGNYGAYAAGAKVGATISLDQQADNKSKVAGYIK